MATEKVFPKGIMVFKKNDNAPDFVIASVVVNPNELVAWLKENKSLMTDYKGSPQLKLQLLNGKENKPYFQVDTYKAAPKQSEPQHIKDKDDLPF